MSRSNDDTVHSKALALRSTSRQVRAQQRARGEELLAHIQRNLVQISDAFYELGEALAEIHNNRLFDALGYDSFAELLLAQKLMSPPQANKLIAVATLVPREAATQLGPEKSYALTRYAHATEAPGVRAVLQEGNIDGTPIKELSLRQLTAITRKVSGKRGGVRNTALGAAQKLGREAQSTLRKVGVAVSVEARARRGHISFLLEMDEASLRELLSRR
jgi:hypothetical protein